MSESSSPVPPNPIPQRLQGTRKRLRIVSRRRFGTDFLLGGLARCGGLSIIGMLIALLVVLTVAAWPSVTRYGAHFLYSTTWRPNSLERPLRDAHGHIVYNDDDEQVMKTLPPEFGALPAIYGTVVSSVLALIFAVPLSFGTALFLVRLSPRFARGPISFLVEFLAAIPSIAYGMWGLFVLSPFLQHHLEPWLKSKLDWIPGVHAWMFTETSVIGGHTITRDLPLTGSDMFCGGLVLAIMILPIITAISRDVLKSVPRAQIEGTLALGATWWQSSWEMLRYSRAALFGAVILGFARAAGETMAVTMVIGDHTKISSSLFAPAQTMSSLLVNEFQEANSDIHRAALAEVALVLLVLSLAFNIVARWLVVGANADTAAAH